MHSNGTHMHSMSEEHPMPKSAVVTARVDPKLKHEAERIFAEIGLTTSQAVALFLKQVGLRNGLPFSVRVPVPNDTTRVALDDARERRDLATYETTDSLFEDLGIR